MALVREKHHAVGEGAAHECDRWFDHLADGWALILYREGGHITGHITVVCMNVWVLGCVGAWVGWWVGGLAGWWVGGHARRGLWG